MDPKGKWMAMNRKGENSFNLDEEKAKYQVGMEVFLKKKSGKIIYLNDHYITVQYEDGIKESFVWHELFEKHGDDSHIIDDPEEETDKEPDENFTLEEEDEEEDEISEEKDEDE